MEDDFIKKLPLREHINKIKKLLNYMISMDPYYFPLSLVRNFLNISEYYTSLLLSSYVLDALSDGKEFLEIFSWTVITLISIFLIHTLQSYLGTIMTVWKENRIALYNSSTEERMLHMDYAMIDSPKIREMRERIQRDNSWGAGLYNAFWAVDAIISTSFWLIGAMVVGIPVIFHITTGGSKLAILTLIILFVVICFAIKLQRKCKKKEDYFLNRTLTDEERKKQVDMSYDWARGNYFDYRNGKDVRIYDSYDLMKSYTVDRINYGREIRKIVSIVLAIGESIAGAVSQLLRGGSYLIVAILALTGNMSIGNVVRLAGCLSNLLTHIQEMGIYISNLDIAARRQASTLEFFEVQDEMYKGKLPLEKRSDNQYQIEFRNVSFQYPGSKQYALRHVSMKLNIGEKLAIVGMNGSGKTTLIKLLCRLYDPTEGEILLNGVNIQKFKRHEYSKLFSVVFQDYKLFAFLLAENVAVDSKYDAAKVEQCLNNAGLEGRLKKLDKGIETYLYKNYEDEGVEISEGEAQKIAIARAMYKKAPFILLDEPTAALDPLAEYEVYSNFDKIVKDKTAIYISHRLSSCRFCQKIAVFHEGELVQMGSHDELLKDVEGKYYELWNAQAQYYE